MNSENPFRWEKVHVEMEPAIFIMKSMTSNEKMGDDSKMMVNRISLSLK